LAHTAIALKAGYISRAVSVVKTLQLGEGFTADPLDIEGSKPTAINPKPIITHALETEIIILNAV
jgi:hypothetical protein